MDRFNFAHYLNDGIEKRRASEDEAASKEAERQNLLPELHSALPKFIKIASRHGLPGTTTLIGGPGKGWEIHGDHLWGLDFVAWPSDLARFHPNRSVLGIDGTLYEARDTSSERREGEASPLGLLCGPAIPEESMTYDGVVATLTFIANTLVRNSWGDEWQQEN